MMRAMAERIVPALALALALSGCAPRYAYSFHVVDPGARVAAVAGQPDVVEDADVRAALVVDPGAGAIRLDLTNKTDAVLQVEWAAIAVTRPDGTSATLRPETDLGWIQPGATAAATLVPFVLPRTGDAALANEGRPFQLAIPMIVRRESKVFHVTLAAHVRRQ